MRKGLLEWKWKQIYRRKHARHESIVQANEEAASEALRGLVRGTVQETLNALLNEEDALLANAARCERKPLTTPGEAALKRHELKGLTFQAAIIERCRRGEASVEEAMAEMYLAGGLDAPRGGHHGDIVGQGGAVGHG